MGKKKTTKTTVKAAKKAKAAQKVEKKEGKKISRSKDANDYEDEDLEDILAKMQLEWNLAHAVSEELAEGPPSRRANATLTACPAGNHLWCIGGEFFSDDGKAYFYNDVFRYSPEKNEWRKFVSPTCPGPRSAHAVASSPVGGGKLFLFGGEFSSLYQNSFHHYRDFWCFDISTHSWDRIETKVKPSARSGHRMAMWKHYVVLFGGFYDPGTTTRYLNDLWLFDVQEYKWCHIEFKETDLKPSPRSGFSFLPTPDGIILHGGYYKEYTKGKRPIGIMLEDTWFLKLAINNDADPKRSSSESLIIKWERRKRSSTSYAPSLRSGCTMTLWPAKNIGVLFGGVTDEDTNEETLESIFWNDLNGYQIAGKGKWISLTLKQPKKKGAIAKKSPNVIPVSPHAGDENPVYEDEGSDDEAKGDIDSVTGPQASDRTKETVAGAVTLHTDDPNSTIPMPRYNAMLAILRNTLYIYGGIFERGSREYTLDDFYSLQLDKMDAYVCLRESGVAIADGDEESSSEEADDESGDDNDSGDEEQDDATHEHGDDHMVAKPDLPLDDSVIQRKLDEQEAARAQAVQFIGVSKDTSRSPEDVISTPLPGETLATFYTRSREYWSQKAHESSDNRGKMLRRDGFSLAEDRYRAYKPILVEVEKILAEAGLDEDEMKREGVRGGAGQSRNRR